LAGQAFNEGERLYSQELLQDAIDRFECSYSLVRHPNTLYNIARTAQEVGNLPLALATYRDYLVRHGDGDDRAAVEEAIAQIEEQLAVREPDEPSQPPDETGDEQSPNTETSDLPSVETRMSRARLVAWISLAAGLVVTGVGAGVWGGALSLGQDIREEWQPSESLNSRDDDVARGQAMETSGWVLMGAGLASLIASIVLFAAFPGREPVQMGLPGRTRLGVMASGGGFGLILGGDLGGW
jgi:hypothetical protein